jgi:hypothetical protein
LRANWNGAKEGERKMGSTLHVTLCQHKVWRSKYGCLSCDKEEQMLKVKACEHPDRLLVFSSGEDAPGKSLDTCEQCKTCGAVIHDYRHNGGQRSPNYPIVRASPLLEPFLSVCQELLEAQAEVRKLRQR